MWYPGDSDCLFFYRLTTYSSILMFLLLQPLAISTNDEAAQVNLDTSKVRAGGTSVGDLLHVPITRTQITENVFYALALSNASLVNG